jgi:hypothetical protein
MRQLLLVSSGFRLVLPLYYQNPSEIDAHPTGRLRHTVAPVGLQRRSALRVDANLRMMVVFGSPGLPEFPQRATL